MPTQVSSSKSVEIGGTLSVRDRPTAFLFLLNCKHQLPRSWALIQEGLNLTFRSKHTTTTGTYVTVMSLVRGGERDNIRYR